jgi:hypothetical protein
MVLKNNEDAAFHLVNTMEMILKMTSEVYSLIEAFTEGVEEFDGDMFTFCTLAVDNGIINIVSGLLARTMTSRESKITLGSDGSVAIEAQTFINATTTSSTEVSTPTPAMRQIALVMKSVNFIPDLVGFVRKVTTSIKGFAKKDEKELEEL